MPIALLCSTLALLAGSPEHLTMVLDVETGSGVTKDLAHVLSEAALVDIREVAPGRVIGAADLRALLSFERQRTLMGCKDDTACYAEIGSAMGAQEIVTGSLSRAGDTYLLILRRMDVAHSRILAEGTRTRHASDEGGLLGDIAGLARQLFAVAAHPAVSPTPSAGPAPMAAPAPADNAEIARAGEACQAGERSSCLYAAMLPRIQRERGPCEAGDPKSCLSLGTALTTCNHAADAVGVLRRACTLGEMQGCGALASIYAQGKKGVARDLEQSVQLYQTACSGTGPQGLGADWGSCFTLALDYAFGHNGVAKNPPFGMQLLERGCNHGHIQSCGSLGEFLVGKWSFTGGQIPIDRPRAAALLRRACDEEDHMACADLRTYRLEP